MTTALERKLLEVHVTVVARRLFLINFGVAVLLLRLVAGVQFRWPLMGLVLSGLAGTVLFTRVVRRLNSIAAIDRVHAAYVVVEILAQTWVVHEVGGVSWGGGFAYLPSLFIVNLLLPLRYGLGLTSLAGLAYAALVLAELHGVIDHRFPFGPESRYLDERFVYVSVLGIGVAIFYTVAFSSNRLGRYIREQVSALQTTEEDLLRARGELDDSRRMLAEWNQHLEQVVAEKTRELADRNEELATLNAVAALLQNAAEVEEGARDGLALVCRTLGLGAAQVLTLREQAESGEAVLSVVGHGLESPVLDRSVLEHVVQAGTIILLDDLKHDETNADLLEDVPGAGAFAAVPLGVHSSLRGAAVFVSDAPRVWTERDRRLMTAVAREVGVALEKAELYRQARARADYINAMATVTRAVGSSLDVETLNHQFGEALAGIIDFDEITIGWFDEERRQVEFQTLVERDPSGDPARVVVPVTKADMEYLLHTREPMLVPDLQAVESVSPLVDAALERGFRCLLSVPLRVQQRAFALLTVLSRHPGRYDERSVPLIQSVAGQVAPGIENLRLYRAAQARARQLEAVADIARIVSSSLDPEEVLLGFIQGVRTLVRYDRASVSLIDEDGRYVRTVRVASPGGAPAVSVAPVADDATLRWFMDQGRDTRYVEDLVAAEPFPERDELLQQGLRAYVITPIVIRGNVIGTMTVASVRPRAYKREHVVLLEQVVERLAVGIENGRLYRQATERAGRIAVMRNMARIVSSSLDLQAVFNGLAAELRTLVQFDLACVSVLAEGDGEYTVAAVYPQGKESARRGARRAIAGSGIEKMVRTGGGDITIDLAATDAPEDADLRGQGIRSVLRVPIRAKDALGGVLVLMHRDPGVYTQEHAGIVEEAAQLIGMALENIRLYDELRRLAETDALTGLYNYRYMQTAVGAELARAKRYGGRFAVLMLDVDNFKLVNDAHGHPAGDAVLREVAEVLRATCREADIKGRLGGDEFLVLLPDTDRDGAVALASRVHEELQRRVNASAMEGLNLVSLSMGAVAYPDDAEDIDQILNRVDAAMYEAKRIGGGTCLARPGQGAMPTGRRINLAILESLVAGVTPDEAAANIETETVAMWAAALGTSLGLTEQDLRIIRLAAMMRDLMRRERTGGDPSAEQADKGAFLAAFGRLLTEAVPEALDVMGALIHQETPYGGGDPAAPAGDDLPLLARILAVARAYTELTMNPAGAEPMNAVDAISRLRALAPSRLDPTLVEELASLVGAGSSPSAGTEAEAGGAPSTAHEAA